MYTHTVVSATSASICPASSAWASEASSLKVCTLSLIFSLA